MKVSNAVYLGSAEKILKRVTDKAALEADRQAREFAKEVAPKSMQDAGRSMERAAEIVVAGKVVATVYRNGGVSLDDKYAGVTASIDRDRLTADQIAREIARITGGAVRAPNERA